MKKRLFQFFSDISDIARQKNNENKNGTSMA